MNPRARFVLHSTLRAFGRDGRLLGLVTLILSLGAASFFALLAAVDGILSPRVPGADPHRLVRIYGVTDGVIGHQPVSLDECVRHRDRSGALSGMSVLSFGRQREIAAAGRVISGVPTVAATADIFEVLRIPLRAGRMFDARANASAGVAEVVVAEALSEEIWPAGDSPLGRSLSIDGEPAVVVGVAGRVDGGVTGGRPPALYVPLDEASRAASSGSAAGEPEPSSYAFAAIGRLGPGLAIEEAQARFDAVSAALSDAGRPRRRLVLTSAVEASRLEALGPTRSVAWLLLGSGCGVLLVACANGGALLLFRAVRRRRETSVRLALGASLGSLMAERILVAAALTASSVGLGLGLARAGLALWARWANPLTAFSAIPSPWTMAARPAGLLVCVAIFSTIVLLVGAGSVLQVRRAASSWPGLLDKEASSVRWRAGGRLFVATQVAVSTVLLVCTGLTTRTVVSELNVPLGFDPAGRLEIAMAPRAGQSLNQTQLYEQVVRALGTAPGVRSAALGEFVPLQDADRKGVVSSATGGRPIPVSVNHVSPAFFRTMGIRIREGRDFAPTDLAGGPGVAVVNETLARQLAPGKSPLGLAVTPRGPGSPRPATIVGVVTDAKVFGPRGLARPILYLPLRESAATSSLVLHVTGDLGIAAATTHAIVRRSAAGVRVVRTEALEDKVSRELAASRRLAIVLGTLGIIAALLTAGGLFALSANAARHRMREFAVRAAIGASRLQVARAALGETAALAGAGLSVGLLASSVAARLLRGYLAGVSPVDPVVYGSIAVILGAAFILAAAPTALGASGVDPARLLREE